MASYTHFVYGLPEDSDYYFDESLADKVYTNLVVFALTEDYDTGQLHQSRHVIPLPPPDLENFIPSNDISTPVIEEWIEKNADLISIQDHNVEQIQKIYDGTYTE